MIGYDVADLCNEKRKLRFLEFTLALLLKFTFVKAKSDNRKLKDNDRSCACLYVINFGVEKDA